MFWTKARYFILGFAVALAAAITTPVLAGAYVLSNLDAGDGEAPTVTLSCGVVDASGADVYAPTGEPIDTTIVVSAPSLAD
jgi:hypothetical protein